MKKISLIAAVLVGITFVMSGTGKIFGHEAVSAQIVDFMTSVVPDVFLTPFTVAALYNVFIPYVFPWAEFILGLCLLVGFMPRLAATLCLFLIIPMTGSNIWAIAKGSYSTCASCFGMWEKIFGTLTPVQALTIDLVLLALVLVVLFLHQGGFLSSRAWISYMMQSNAISGYSRKFAQKTVNSLAKVEAAITRHSRIFAYCAAGLAGLALIIFGAVTLFNGQSSAPVVVSSAAASDVLIKNVTETAAVITWTTDKPVQNHILIYNRDRVPVKDIAEKSAYTAHLVAVGGLSPGTLYYFQVATDNTTAFKLASAYSFTTVASDSQPLSIYDVGVSVNTGTSVTIIWTTNKPATGEVEYWPSGSSSHITVKATDESGTSHRAILTPLDPSVAYRYKVKSADAAAGENYASDEKMFTPSASANAVLAPDFTLKTLDGKTVRLSDYRGKGMLDFWQSSCADCRQKMAIIQGAIGKLPADKAAVLAIHVEGKEAVVQAYVTSEKITVPIAMDLNRDVSNLYNVTGVPTIFFVDGNGVIRLKDVEFATPDELLAIFNTLLTSK